jgi:hypothetical protein
MMWMDDLRDELRRRQSGADDAVVEARRPEGSTDAVVARTNALVRTLQEQMNQTLLGGRGSVWDAPAVWGVHLWELWWEPTRERGPYIVVVLLYDSRGTPYLKVQGRRLALDDARIERRLQRALRAAFMEPLIYTPRVNLRGGMQEFPWPAHLGRERSRVGQSSPRTTTRGVQAGAEAVDAGERSWGQSTPARRRGRRNERNERNNS